MIGCHWITEAAVVIFLLSASVSLLVISIAFWRDAFGR